MSLPTRRVRIPVPGYIGELFLVAFLRPYRTNEAASLLGTIDANSVSQSEVDPSFGANLALAKSQVALSRGNQQEAVKQFSLAQQVLRQSSASPFQKRWLASVQARLGKTT